MDDERTHKTLLDRSFFSQPTLQVARQILGAFLVRIQNGQRIVGVITETEAYIGQADLSCHASHGKTERNKVMFGAPGFAYVYFTYGMHWLLNLVTEVEGFPAAVLLRAIIPIQGKEIIAQRRGKANPTQWTNGPAKLCQALNIDGSFNGIDLCDPDSALFIEAGNPLPDEKVRTSARIGLNNVPQPWKDIPWRFYVSAID